MISLYKSDVTIPLTSVEFFYTELTKSVTAKGMTDKYMFNIRSIKQMEA